MIHNYSKIFSEIKRLINKHIFICLGFMTSISVIICLLCLFDVLPVYALYSLILFVPAAVILLSAVHFIDHRIEQLARTWLISMMASHAKQVFETYSHDFPDTHISDSRIKMCYLSKNGIDVDGALKRLNSDVDAYNKLVLSFIGECGKCEDEIYDLLSPQTLFQYAHKVHALRVRSNELGLIKLTDTTFFHEIEAYAGNYDVVRANWRKLSSELDEVYECLSKYADSLGIKDNSAAVKDDMTLKKWGEQLQDAFKALEAYDTDKAKQLLNELMQYHINADMTKTLQEIISGIDYITTGSC